MEQFLETFFSWEHFKQSFPSVVEGFKTNLSLMFVAEGCVLVWGLVLALLRSGRSRATMPLRWLTVGYIDLFRAIPGAYVAEVYRAGIESIHWSQTAAARSLGLSQGKTMRFVVLPQAVRRVVPPLLNDFIGLQKDTAFIGIIGVLDGFRRAQIYAGTEFNLSSFTGLALCFVVITIPMTRITDHLLKRDQQRMRVGGR